MEPIQDGEGLMRHIKGLPIATIALLGGIPPSASPCFRKHSHPLRQRVQVSATNPPAAVLQLSAKVSLFRQHFTASAKHAGRSNKSRTKYCFQSAGATEGTTGRTSKTLSHIRRIVQHVTGQETQQTWLGCMMYGSNQRTKGAKMPFL